MSEEEKKEYSALKDARAEQGGFFTPQQKKRWEFLHDLQAESVMRLIKFVEEKRKMRLN